MEAQASAQQLLDNLSNDPWKFDDFARSQSNSPARDRAGDLGLIRRGQMDPALDAAAFKLDTGEFTSAVIDTHRRFQIIKCTE